MLACAVCLVYLPSFENDFIYDDFPLIVHAPTIQSLSDAVSVFAERHFSTVPYYRPAVKMTFQLQKTLSGNHPAPYHAFNLAVAAGAALVFFIILISKPFSFHPWSAFLASLAWSVHPAASSCVYPTASGREALMPALFMLVGLFAHMRAGPFWRGSALLSFVVAILGREQAVVLPFVFAAADFLGLSDDPPARRWKEWSLRYAPFIIISAVYFAMRSVTLEGRYTVRPAERPLIEICVSALYAIQTAIAPYFDLKYEPTFSGWFSAPRVLAAASVMCGILLIALRQDISTKRRVFFWIVFSFLTLLPTTNIIRQEARCDERYLFLPLAGFVAVTLETFRALKHQTLRVAATTLAAAVIVLWSGASWRRARFFRTNITFLIHWTQTSPDDPYPHYYLGTALANAGRLLEAVRPLERAVLLMPDLHEALYNLGNTRLQLGEAEEAVRLYYRTLRLRPDHIGAMSNLGAALVALGRNTEAVSALREAVKKDPSHADSRYNLGVALACAGLKDLALREFKETLRRHPHHVAARHNLAVLIGSNVIRENESHNVIVPATGAFDAN